MGAPKFKLITELMPLIRRDFPLVDAQAGIVNPNASNPLLEGEWLELTAENKLQRGGDANAATGDEGAWASVFPVHTEKGRYDVQSIGRVNVIFLGMYEAETELVELDSGGTPLAVGDALTVWDRTFFGGVRRVLGKFNRVAPGAGAGSNNAVTVGFVSKISGTKVRFVHFGNQKKL